MKFCLNLLTFVSKMMSSSDTPRDDALLHDVNEPVSDDLVHIYSVCAAGIGIHGCTTLHTRQSNPALDAVLANSLASSNLSKWSMRIPSTIAYDITL